MSTDLHERRFQLWSYDISHGLLLIRSPKRPDFDQNVDLVFAGVEYVALPRHLRGLSLVPALSGDIAIASEAVGHVLDPKKVFVLVSQGRRHLVVAAGHELRVHDDDIFAGPLPADDLS